MYGMSVVCRDRRCRLCSSRTNSVAVKASAPVSPMNCYAHTPSTVYYCTAAEGVCWLAYTVSRQGSVTQLLFQVNSHNSSSLQSQPSWRQRLTREKGWSCCAGTDHFPDGEVLMHIHHGTVPGGLPGVSGGDFPLIFSSLDSTKGMVYPLFSCMYIVKPSQMGALGGDSPLILSYLDTMHRRHGLSTVLMHVHHDTIPDGVLWG